MILYFNPGHETAVLNSSKYYMAPANVVAMQQELAYLPAWYGNKEDVVVVHSLLDTDFFNYISKNLKNVPRAITYQDLATLAQSEISLWGISPQAVHFFQELNNEYETQHITPKWEEEYTYLNSRQAARDCLSALSEEIPDIQNDIIPKFYTELEKISTIIENADYKLLAKSPYSSSGRGLLWLPTTGLTRTELQILHGILKKQGAVAIERVLEREIDFAMEFLSDGNGSISFTGYSLFQTNEKGAYQGNYIGNQDDINSQLICNLSSQLLDKVKAKLTEILKDKYANIYKGCIGVDMMVYKDKGEHKLHPCLEINMRYNMGYLALKLYENHISPSSHGHFHLDFSVKESQIAEKHMQMQQDHPAIFESGLLKRGYLALCPVSKKSKYWAYILIKD